MRQVFERFAAVLGAGNRKTFSRKQFSERLGRIDIVIDQQYLLSFVSMFHILTGQVACQYALSRANAN